MTAKRIAKATALLALLALIPAAGPAATASADDIDGGNLTIRLNRGLLKAVRAGGAKLLPVRPAVGRPKVLSLPLEGGGLEYTGEGRLVMSGGIELVAAGRRAVFRDLVLDTAFGTLMASLGRQRFTLATQFGLSSEQHGFAADLELRKLALTRRAVAAIDRSLGTRNLLRAGQSLGRTTANARFETTRVYDGRTYLDVGDPFLEKLKALKVNTKPIGNAWALGTYFAIPDTVGEVALDLSGGKVVSDDGIALKQFESDAELALHNVEYDFDRGVVRAGITTAFTLPSEAKVTPLARFRLTVTHKNANTGELSGGATGTLTNAFADRLNDAFAAPKGIAPPFAGGAPVQISFGLRTNR